MELLLSLAALLLAGIVQASSGFGFSLVAVGLVGIALADAKAGAIVPVFANTVLTGAIVWRYYRHVQVRSVLPFLTASLTSVPLGVLLLAKMSPLWVSLGIGIILLVSGTYALLPRENRRDWHPFWLGVPCGLLSGSLAGAFNTGGPPAVAYMSNRSMTRFEFVATLQFVFLMAGIVRIGFLGSWGMFDRRILLVGLLGIGAALIGGVIGTRILNRLSDRLLRVYVCVFQLVLGGVYVLRACSLLLHPEVVF